MAVRQYIGARYVPKVVGDWDINLSYEPLSIVVVPNVASYISKQFVPVGIAITNTDYWALSGSINGFINSLDSRVTTVENHLTNDIDPDLLQAQNDIADLQFDMGDLMGRSKRYVLISDSYGGRPTVNDSWAAIFEQYASGDVFRFYAGSAGFAHAGDGGLIAQTILSTNYNNITNPDTITDIVFGMGLNDYNESNATIRNAYDALATYLSTTFPNARIHMAFIGNSNAISGDVLSNLLAIMRSRSNLHGWHYCDGVEYPMHYSVFKDVDGVHPNASGAAELGLAVYNCVYRNSGYRFHLRSIGQLQLTGGSSVSGAGVVFDGNIATILIPECLGNGSFSFTGTQWTKIGEFSTEFIYNGVAQFTAPIYSTDNEYPAYMDFLITGKNLYGRWVTGSTKTLTVLQMCRGQYHFDTIMV